MALEDYINGPHDDEDEDDNDRKTDYSGSDTIEIYDPRPENDDED